MLRKRIMVLGVAAFMATQFAVTDNAEARKPVKKAANDNTSSEEEDCGCLVDGRFTGGGLQIVDGVRITRGLTLHCDRRLSNNLQINWQGNHFHLTDHDLTIACFDDPDIQQTPPRAPLDTLRGQGDGRFNGVDGYRIRFVLVDGGEPGTNDMMGITILGPDREIILQVDKQYLTRGNLQAHADQPHRNR